MEEMKKAGLTRPIGVSNYPMIHLQYLATRAGELPVVDQVERHPLLTQQPLIYFNRAHHIVTQAWSPLGRGNILTNPLLEQIGKRHGKSPAQVVLRWQLQSGVAFIPKATHADHISQSIDGEMGCLNLEAQVTRCERHCRLSTNKYLALIQLSYFV